MDYNEFSEKIKSKYPQYKDIDNKELAQKMIAKYPEYKEQVSFDVEVPKKETKGIDLTPSGLFKGSQDVVASAIAAPFKANKDNISISEAYKQNKEILDKRRKENPTPIQDFLVDTAAYSLIPESRAIAPVARFASNVARYGTLPGALEGLKNNNVLGGAGLGTGLGAGLLAGLPVVGNVAKKAGQLIPLAGGTVAKTLGRLQPKTLERAVQPGSKALDLTPEQAQNLLMNTTEAIRNDYNSLLVDKGNQVGRLLADLPSDVKFKAGDILADYDKIYNNYSLSKNELLNPAKNATKRELSQIEDLVYGDSSGNIQEFKNDLDDLKFPNGKLNVQVGKKKGKFWSHTIEDTNNDIVIANRRFNDEILGGLKEHPEWVNDPKKIEALEKHIYNNYSVPEDYYPEMYNRLYKALEKGGKLDPNNNPVTPKELYDINKNVSNMVDWDKPDAALKNDVLEQIYGMNAEKISDLSPELKNANQVYSDLMDFQKNEGIRRILNNSNNIDSASSALKNYNSTVTKGNTNRNIQDLESILVNEGYSPFLNDIDDVNAAMDLNNIRTTGDSFWANVGTQLARPMLRAARAYNNSSLPSKVENIKNLLPFAKRLLTPAAVDMAVPLLYGGVEYNDY